MSDRPHSSGRSLREQLARGTALLADAGIREAENDARILLEYAANINRSYFYLHGHDEMDVSDAEDYTYLLRRRAGREPVQYLTGEAPFYGEVFYVTPDVLIPRQDTEILVEEAMRRIEPGMHVLDLCTGSGCILLTILREASVTGTGSDISAAALAVAERNRRRMHLHANWIESDLFARIGGRFDMIVSNPPYIRSAELSTLDPEVRGHEPVLALDGGADGLCAVRRIVCEAPRYLAPEGWLLLEIGCGQGQEACALLEKENYREICLARDLEHRDRVVIGRAPACAEAPATQ